MASMQGVPVLSPSARPYLPFMVVQSSAPVPPLGRGCSTPPWREASLLPSAGPLIGSGRFLLAVRRGRTGGPSSGPADFYWLFGEAEPVDPTEVRPIFFW